MTVTVNDTAQFKNCANAKLIFLFHTFHLHDYISSEISTLKKLKKIVIILSHDRNLIKNILTDFLHRFEFHLLYYISDKKFTSKKLEKIEIILSHVGNWIKSKLIYFFHWFELHLQYYISHKIFKSKNLEESIFLTNLNCTYTITLVTNNLR